MTVPIQSRRVSFREVKDECSVEIIDAPVGESHGSIVMAHCFTCSKDLKAGVRIARGWPDTAGRCCASISPVWGIAKAISPRQTFKAIDSTSSPPTTSWLVESSPPCLLFGHSFGGAASISVGDELVHVKGIVTLAAPSDTRHLADIWQHGLSNRKRRSRPSHHWRTRFSDLETNARRFSRIRFDRRFVAIDQAALDLHSPTDTTVGYHHAMRIFSLVQQSNADRPQRRMSAFSPSLRATIFL